MNANGAIVPDSISPVRTEYSFTPKQLILPGALIAVGTIGIYVKPLKHLNSSIADGMNNLSNGKQCKIDEYLQFLPAVGYIGLDWVGLHAKHTLKERAFIGATAYLASTAITCTAKYSFREQRPNSMERNSFPSGHTARAFTGAELVREEYGTITGIVAYTAATGVAFMRLYNGRHWLNDVIAGAGIGILSARIGFWMLPLYKKWFNTKLSDATIALMPAYNNHYNTISLNMAMTF